MIHYNVWFSFKEGAEASRELARCRTFLEDVLSRRLIAGYRLLKNRAMPGESKLPGYHAIIEFESDVQFGLPFAEVRGIGIHLGKHGVMIENVDRFEVEVFEEL